MCTYFLVGGGGSALFLVLLRNKHSWAPHLPSFPEVISFQKLICPSYLRPDLGKPETSLRSGMTNWCWSLGPVHHLLIHHSEGHISLSNLLKSLWIAWLESMHLYPTPHAPQSLEPFWKACLPGWPLEKQHWRSFFILSFHPLRGGHHRALSCSQRCGLPASVPAIPKSWWRSNFTCSQQIDILSFAIDLIYSL